MCFKKKKLELLAKSKVAISNYASMYKAKLDHFLFFNFEILLILVISYNLNSSILLLDLFVAVILKEVKQAKL